VLFVWTQPPVASHVSVVHTLPSSQAMVANRQPRVGSQVSAGAGVPVVAGEEGAQGEVEQGGGETLRGAGVEDHLVEAAEGEAHAGEIEATLEELGRIEDVVPILVLSRPGGCQQRAVDDRT